MLEKMMSLHLNFLEYILELTYFPENLH